MKSVAEIRDLSQKDRSGVVNAADLMAGMLVDRPAVTQAETELGLTKGPLPGRLEDMMRVLKAAHAAELNLPAVMVLLSYVGTADRACEADGDCAVRISHPVAAKMTGLNESAIKRAVGKLTRNGCLVRQQARKEKGCAATSLVSDKAFALLGMQGGAAISGLDLDLQSLLVNESHEVISLVKQSWDGLEMLADSVAALWRGSERDLAQVKMRLANRISDAQEALMGAAELQAKRDADEALGVYIIDADDGEVRVDSSVVNTIAQYAAADVKFGVETLNLLSKVRPGMVTCQKAPELLAEVLYSRTFGFAVKGEYAKAQAFVINTMRKGWGRPKSIRDYWYVATSKACSVRLSTRGSISVH